MAGLDLKSILSECIEGLQSRYRRANACARECRKKSEKSPEGSTDSRYWLANANGYQSREAHTAAVLSEVRRWAAAAELITAEDCDGRELVSAGNETVDMVATPDASRSYGLKWSVDGEEPEDAEKTALLGLAAALRCYHLQEAQPCL